MKNIIEKEVSGSDRNKDPKQVGEKEVHEGGHVFIHMAGSLCLQQKLTH